MEPRSKTGGSKIVAVPVSTSVDDIAHTTDDWCDDSPESVLSELGARPRDVLYGLPCARCQAYYDAELDACPICACTERVSPVVKQSDTQSAAA